MRRDRHGLIRTLTASGAAVDLIGRNVAAQDGIAAAAENDIFFRIGSKGDMTGIVADVRSTSED